MELTKTEITYNLTAQEERAVAMAYLEDRIEATERVLKLCKLAIPLAVPEGRQQLATLKEAKEIISCFDWLIGKTSEIETEYTPEEQLRITITFFEKLIKSAGDFSRYYMGAREHLVRIMSLLKKYGDWLEEGGEE